MNDVSIDDRGADCKARAIDSHLGSHSDIIVRVGLRDIHEHIPRLGRAIGIVLEDHCDSSVGDAEGLPIGDTTGTSTQRGHSQADGRIGLLNRWSRFGVDRRTDWGTDEDIPVVGEACDNPRYLRVVDRSEQRRDDLLLGRERGELNHSGRWIDDVRIAIELEGIGGSPAEDRESIPIEDSTRSAACKGQVQLQTLWDLQAITAVVFERHVSAIGVFDGEAIPIIDLIPGSGIDYEAILVVDVDIIDLVVSPNTGQRLEHDLIGCGVVGEGIVDTFDQEPTVFGDGHYRTWEAIATGSADNRIVVDACSAAEVGRFETILELDSEFRIDTAGKLDNRLGLVAVDLLRIVVDGQKRHGGRSDEVRSVDCTTVFEDVCTQTTRGSDVRIVGSEDTVEVAIGRQDWARCDSDCGFHAEEALSFW